MNEHCIYSDVLSEAELAAECVASTHIDERIRQSGIRLTRQRSSLGQLLFANGDRHVTAEMLHEEARQSNILLSLATVYNVLHQFTDAGLLRRVAVDGSRSWYDTNVSDHYHFLAEDDERLIDISNATCQVASMPTIPDGMEVSRIDIVVRLRRKQTTAV